MALLARCRLALARRPWIHWLVVACCTLSVWMAVQHARTAAHHAERRWGTERTVWVSTADTPAGGRLHIERRRYPIAVVPAAALTAAPAAAVAARAVAAGAVLVAADVVRSGEPGGWSVFALPGDGAPALQPGDLTSVFGGGQRLCDGVAAVTPDAGDAGTRSIDVAVPPDCAAAVAQQLVAHSIVLARAVPSHA